MLLSLLISVPKKNEVIHDFETVVIYVDLWQVYLLCNAYIKYIRRVSSIREHMVDLIRCGPMFSCGWILGFQKNVLLITKFLVAAKLTFSVGCSKLCLHIVPNTSFIS